MITGPGEWGDDGEPSPPSPRPPAPAGAAAARSAIDATLASVDLDASVQDAVRAAMRKRLEGVAAAAVNDLLTEPLLADLREAADKAARAAFSAEKAAPEEPELYYPDLLAFVTEYLTPMYRRAISGTGTTWCAQWWRHAEGIVRLEALWRSWEHLRQDPHTGLSVWLRDHADHHMAVLLSAEGPFKGCKPDKHAERVAKLPTAAPPDGRVTLR